MRVKNGDEIIPNIWAVGDVTGKLMLAHTAAAQGTIAVDNICGGNVEINYKSIPAATFTHPEISSVGLSEVEAKEISTKARDIDTKSNVFATKITPGCPVKIELTDAKSKEVVETLEVASVSSILTGHPGVIFVAKTFDFVSISLD